ncbi:MAG: hypothetical protein WC906_03050 [Parcubacteria group bacterium]|jgi:hypothetical protein
MARAFENPSEFGDAKAILRQLQKVGDDDKDKRKKSYQEIKGNLAKKVDCKEPNKIESEKKYFPNPVEQEHKRKWMR